MITHGMSGKLGHLLFRWRGNQSVISILPDYRKKVWSRSQKENRKKFSEAMEWAGQIFEDLAVQEYYHRRRKKNQTKWNVAVKDYMTNLRVRKLNFDLYHGLPGDKIMVTLFDFFRTKAVIVTIFDVRGFILESEMAEQTSDHYVYRFTASVPNPSYRKCRIVVKVANDVVALTQSFPLTPEE